MKTDLKNRLLVYNFFYFDEKATSISLHVFDLADIVVFKTDNS